MCNSHGTLVLHVSPDHVLDLGLVQVGGFAFGESVAEHAMVGVEPRTFVGDLEQARDVDDSEMGLLTRWYC